MQKVTRKVTQKATRKVIEKVPKGGSNIYWLGGTAHTDQQGALRAKERLRSTRSREKTKATRRCPHFGDIASLCIEPGRGAFRLYEEKEKEKEKERELPTGVLRPLATRR